MEEPDIPPPAGNWPPAPKNWGPPPPPKPKPKHWLLWSLLATVLVSGVAGTASLLFADDSPEQKDQLTNKIEQALSDPLPTDAAVSPADVQRDLLVTSPKLRKPFTVTIPEGFDARLSSKDVAGTGEYALFAKAPGDNGFAPYYLVEVTEVKSRDLEKLAQQVVDGTSKTQLISNFQAVGGPVKTSVGSRPAVQRDYTLRQAGSDIHGRAVVTIVGKQPVIFYLTALETQFSAHESRFTAFLASAKGN